MADVNFGDDTQGIGTNPVGTQMDGGADGVQGVGTSPDGMQTDGGAQSGIESNVYSTAELSDPNNINVELADDKVPIVVLFGPPSCGKTMTLVRMTRYLKKKDYIVKPVEEFRPNFDTNYDYMCKNFNKLIDSEDAAESTSNINFMLVNVLKGNKRICQILEAPGEHYFDKKMPDADFPKYINSIISSQNRKIWLFFVEPSATSKFEREDRVAYVDKIAKLKTDMARSDKSIFIFNKIDKSSYATERGKTNMKAAQEHIGNIYPGIYAPFKNQNPITKWFKEYNCNFVPFKTGSYNQTQNGKVVFTAGPDEYPKMLWSTLLKNING